MEPVPSSPHPGSDLLAVLQGAWEQAGSLLTAGEAHVLAVVCGLSPAALELYARLSRRAARVFRDAELRYEMDLPRALAELLDAGLIHRNIPDDACLEAFTVPELKAACAAQQLPTTGRRADIEARLRGRRWVAEPVLLLAHTALISRLERLYFQQARVTADILILERLGRARWPRYTPTGGAGLFPHRRALRIYEQRHTLPVDAALTVVEAGEGSWGATTWQRCVLRVMEAAADAATWARLAQAGVSVEAPWAAQLEREGRRAEAMAVCQRGTDDPVQALALGRIARRLGPSLGQTVPPQPLQAAPQRTLLLPFLPATPRPLFVVDGVGRVVEDAVIATLRGVQREVFHAENWFWTSLFALVFRDLYWLPVPGMLPVPRLLGPLDLGSPAFYLHRRAAIDARLAQIAAEGPAAVARTWEGECLAGLNHPDAVIERVDAVPGPLAAAVLGRLAREGWSAARGLPDLLILPGSLCTVPGLVPSRLDGEARLVEVKAPGDRVSDHQRVWHDALVEAGVFVEIWFIRSHDGKLMEKSTEKS